MKAGKLIFTLVALVLVVAAPGAAAPAKAHAVQAHAKVLPDWGERIAKKQVLIPFYDWDTGKTVMGSTPVTCQYVNTCAPGTAKLIPKAELQPFYLVVYPLFDKGKIAVDCAHWPADNCPDHGPLVAAGAKELVPSVYGDGVWGHVHIGAGLESKEYRVIASPILVIFKTREAARHEIRTRAQIMHLVHTNQAFLYPVPQFDFINYVVPASLYAQGIPVKPKPMKMP